ncbi:MAG: sugar ABC transporter substrate-binding protein [Verrucomicrobia bacterium]|nr:sugar ABC transporter substrate-binding protein [Verrucomicrobiota bacterium]MBV9299962.1 sugar ABC transporter substrate-binding protein [Verrucomicrobiota bacterium]
MIKSKLLPLLVVVCAASLLVPLKTLAQRKPKIIMITHGQAADSFWLIVQNGAASAAEETNSDLAYRSPEKFDLPAMSRMIDEAVASKPDALIVSIPDAVALSQSIRAAVAAKIPVVSINSGLEVSRQLGCLMHIGQQDGAAGKKAGERMKALGVKNAVIINQEVGNLALEERIKGFREGFEGPFHHVQILPVMMEFQACQKAVTDYVEKYSSMDGIVALGPIAAEPALQALDQEGKIGKIKVCVFDISPAVLAALGRKQIEFAIDQQQWLQGYLPVIFLANYVKHGSILQNDLILTGPSFVTSENAQKVVDLLSMGFH